MASHYGSWHEGKTIFQPGSLTVISKRVGHKSKGSYIELCTKIPKDKLGRKAERIWGSGLKE
jgi:hypothetical protein